MQNGLDSGFMQGLVPGMPQGMSAQGLQASQMAGMVGLGPGGMSGGSSMGMPSMDHAMAGVGGMAGMGMGPPGMAQAAMGTMGSMGMPKQDNPQVPIASSSVSLTAQAELELELSLRGSLLVQQQRRIVQLEDELQKAWAEIEKLRQQIAKYEAEKQRAEEGKKAQQPRYWTPDEHRNFLEALDKYGAKDVKAISNHVGTRTPTQVRTHAQKYFLRLQAKEAEKGGDTGLLMDMTGPGSEDDIVGPGGNPGSQAMTATTQAVAQGMALPGGVGMPHPMSHAMPHVLPQGMPTGHHGHPGMSHSMGHPMVMGLPPVTQVQPMGHQMPYNGQAGGMGHQSSHPHQQMAGLVQGTPTQPPSGSASLMSGAAAQPGGGPAQAIPMQASAAMTPDPVTPQVVTPQVVTPQNSEPAAPQRDSPPAAQPSEGDIDKADTEPAADVAPTDDTEAPLDAGAENGEHPAKKQKVDGEASEGEL